MFALRNISIFLSALALLVEAQDPTLIVAGCYDNKGKTTNAGTNTYQSQGNCQQVCIKLSKTVFALTQGNLCYCGDSLPSTGKSSFSEDDFQSSDCDTPCFGYPQSCGGQKSWLFGYTGLNRGSSSGSESTDSPSVATVTSGATVVVTAPSDQSPTGSSGGSKSGANKAGVAAGAVVGVIALVALGVGAWLAVRRKRRLRAEEEYRAAVAAKEFVESAKKPSPDQRLDPVLLQQRRLSDGSIADNQDYSRRILKVTNPDGL